MGLGYCSRRRRWSYKCRGRNPSGSSPRPGSIRPTTWCWPQAVARQPCWRPWASNCRSSLHRRSCCAWMPPGLVKTLVSNDLLEIREASDGSLLAAEDYIDAQGPQGPQAIAEQALASIRQSFRGAESVTLRSVEVGQRPMPVDQLPIIGPCHTHPRLYLAVMHAGVTLAPTVGRLICQELLQARQCSNSPLAARSGSVINPSQDTRSRVIRTPPWHSSAGCAARPTSLGCRSRSARSSACRTGYPGWH